MLLGLASGGVAHPVLHDRRPHGAGGHRRTAFGFFSAAALFGGAVSPSVAGLLAHWDLRGIYYLDAALFVALALAPAARPRGQPAAPRSRPRPARRLNAPPRALG